MSSKPSSQRDSFKVSGSLVKARTARASIVRDAKAKSASVPSRLSVVDTSLGAYGKHEPFQAFTTLSRLLISLVSRPGGCALKFTPDEHKLSLHLLSIVEPFITSPSSGASHLQGRIQLILQPTEILDAIVSHIEKRDDLLALAATCQRMRMVVVPRHSEYRTIRCKISSIRVWSHLVVHKALARNVRRLEILDERWSPAATRSTPSHANSNSISNHLSNPFTGGNGRTELIPPSIGTTDTDLESTDDELHLHSKHERYFVAALSKMTGLTSFSWGCNHSPLSIDSPIVWDALIKCKLTQIEVADNLIFGPGSNVDDEDSEESSSSDGDSDGEASEGIVERKCARPVASMPLLPTISSLAFSSTKYPYGTTKNPDLTRIREILNQCPNLQILRIAHISQRNASGSVGPAAAIAVAAATSNGATLVLDPFLLLHRFQFLTTLSISNLRCTPFGGVEALGAFLSAHRNLEFLELDIGNLGRGINAGTAIVHARPPRLVLEPGSLMKLKEVRAQKEVVTAILACVIGETSVQGVEDCDGNTTSLAHESLSLRCVPSAGLVRPLTTIKGIRLHSSYSCATDTNPNLPLFMALKNPLVGDQIRRLELSGFDEVEDVKRLVECIKNVAWLDLGRKRGCNTRGSSHTAGPVGPVNLNDWLPIISLLPSLTTFHGVKLFYELSPGAEASVTHSGTTSTVSAVSAQTTSSAVLSLADRSRLKKNEEVASTLVWKCPKLRRVDHWEDGTSKVILLVKDTLGSNVQTGGKGKEKDGGREKVRWEVRRLKG